MPSSDENCQGCLSFTLIQQHFNENSHGCLFRYLKFCIFLIKNLQIQRTRVPLQAKTVTIINHIALTTTIQEVDHRRPIYVINQVADIHSIIPLHCIIIGQPWDHL